MNTPAEVDSPQSSPTPPWLGPLVLVGSAAVLLAVFWPRNAAEAKEPVAEPTKIEAAVEVTPQQILASIPTIPLETESGKAMKKALERLQKSPQDARAWITLGDILAQAQRSAGQPTYYDHAENAYRRALKLAPKDTEAMTGLAWVFGGRHRFLESVEWATRALEVDPNNQMAHGIIGDAALEQGDYNQAFDHYQKMMDLRPDLSSWSRGAHLLWITGNRTRAIPLMQKAIRSGAPFAENTAWCRAKLAIMLLDDGALLPAAQALAPAVQAAPEDTHVLLAAGRITTAQGDLESATNYYKKVLEYGPNHDALAALGDLCVAKGDTVGAEEYYQQVEALHVANVAAGAHDHTAIAIFYADHDRNLDEALKLAEQHKDTRNVTEADVLAWVRFKSGDLPRAIEALKVALSQNTPDPELQFHAGMIAIAAGDRASAQNHLQKALSMNSRFHPLFATVAAQTLEKLTEQRASQRPIAKVQNPPSQD